MPAHEIYKTKLCGQEVGSAALKNWVASYETRDSIFTDNGEPFISETSEELFAFLGIQANFVLELLGR